MLKQFFVTLKYKITLQKAYLVEGITSVSTFSHSQLWSNFQLTL